MKIFRVFEKMCWPTSYFLWRILYLYIVTLNCKIENLLFRLYLKIFNIFEKKNNKLQYNGKFRKWIWSYGVSNPRPLYSESDSLPTELVGHQILAVDDRYITKTFTCTISQHFQIFWAILVVWISWGQFPKPLSPNMFIFHSHCQRILRKNVW